MSPADVPGSPPPEVPDEFAEAYRAAYLRALEDAAGAALPLPEMSEDEPSHVREDAWEEPEPEPGLIAPEPPRHAADEADDGSAFDTALRDEPDATEVEAATPWERARGSRWFVPVLLAGLALVLVVAAYGVGKIFAGNVGSGTGAPTAARSTPAASAAATPRPTRSKPTKGAYKGRVKPVQVRRAAAGCVAAPAVDSSGHPVDYRPGNMIDGDRTTAWRCDGTAIGQQVTLKLPGSVKVAEVGLVPGYAKTDEKSGVDRYAENNRITRVRWTLGDGRSYTQTMSGDPKDRSMRTVRVPATTSDQITLQVLAVARGARNTTMISEVEVGAAK